MRPALWELLEGRLVAITKIPPLLRAAAQPNRRVVGPFRCLWANLAYVGVSRKPGAALAATPLGGEEPKVVPNQKATLKAGHISGFTVGL